MTARKPFDLVVIGADLAGLAAAAAAARAGASVAVVRLGVENFDRGPAPAPANAVWRRLDLYANGLDLAPVAAQASLASGRAPIVFTENRSVDERLLADRDPRLPPLWSAFIDRLSRGGGAAPATPFDEAGADRLDPGPYASANEALDEAFDDELLKTHFISVALAPLGLAGDEPGSARALADCAGAGWPVRRANGRPLDLILEGACASAKVEIVTGRILSLSVDDAGVWRVALDNAPEIRARAAMASSAAVADAAGLDVVDAEPALRRRAGAEATIRIRFDEPVAVEGAPGGSVVFVADSRAEFAAARDAMLEGRLPDEPPFSFEVSDGEIVARAPFAPALIRDGDGFREWTGQDRQILGRQILARIEPHLKSPPGPPREVDVRIAPAGGARNQRRAAKRSARAPAPAPSHEPLGAAVAFALRATRRG